MSSGFVSSNDLDEERKQRQSEWEKVRKPEDPQLAPEPEVCNKTLYEQLRDNREAKQAEFDEAKKFKNMIRGIDEDESDFLSQVDEIKAQAEIKKKKEEEELLKEMASARYEAPEPSLKAKVEPPAPKAKAVSKQASILSSAIKRKSTTQDCEAPAKVVRQEPPVIPAISSVKVIGSIPGMGDYEASSDSDSDDSSDSEPGFIPMLQVTRPEKKGQDNC